jgi:hypothetical protein
VALLALGVAAALLPVHGRLWVVEAVLLGVGFWLTVWALRGISAAEIVPLAPAPIRPLLEWVAAREPGGN